VTLTEEEEEVENESKRNEEKKNKKKRKKTGEGIEESVGFGRRVVLKESGGKEAVVGAVRGRNSEAEMAKFIGESGKVGERKGADLRGKDGSLVSGLIEMNIDSR